MRSRFSLAAAVAALALGPREQTVTLHPSASSGSQGRLYEEPPRPRWKRRDAVGAQRYPSGCRRLWRAHGISPSDAAGGRTPDIFAPRCLAPHAGRP